MPHFRQFFAAHGRISYLIADLDRREAVIIDPDDALCSLYLGVLDEMQLQLVFTLLTHVHAGRILPGANLRSLTKAVLKMAPGDAGSGPGLQDGQVLAFGDEVVRAWLTPGHTRNSVSYLWRDRVFTGDALLIGDCGRIAETGADAGVLFDSLTRRLLSLPDETLVYPAHDFAGRAVSSIGEQRHTNPKLKGTTRDEFIALYGERSFALPTGLHASHA